MYRDMRKSILDNLSKHSVQICLDKNKMGFYILSGFGYSVGNTKVGFFSRNNSPIYSAAHGLRELIVTTKLGTSKFSRKYNN
jgi:hypothetical protein